MKWSKRKVGKMKRRKKKGNSPRQALSKINISLYFFYEAAVGQSLPSCPAPCACTQPRLASRLKVPVTPSFHPASLTVLTAATNSVWFCTQTLSCSISFHEADTSTFLLQDLRHGQHPKPLSPGCKHGVPPCHSRHLPHPCHPSAAFSASQAARAGIPTGKGQIPSGRLRPHQHEADPFGNSQISPERGRSPRNAAAPVAESQVQPRRA